MLEYSGRLIERLDRSREYLPFPGVYPTRIYFWTQQWNDEIGFTGPKNNEYLGKPTPQAWKLFSKTHCSLPPHWVSRLIEFDRSGYIRQVSSNGPLRFNDPWFYRYYLLDTNLTTALSLSEWGSFVPLKCREGRIYHWDKLGLRGEFLYLLARRRIRGNMTKIQAGFNVTFCNRIMRRVNRRFLGTPDPAELLDFGTEEGTRMIPPTRPNTPPHGPTQNHLSLVTSFNEIIRQKHENVPIIREIVPQPEMPRNRYINFINYNTPPTQPMAWTLADPITNE